MKQATANGTSFSTTVGWVIDQKSSNLCDIMAVYTGGVIPITDDDTAIGVVSDDGFPFLAIVSDQEGNVVGEDDAEINLNKAGDFPEGGSLAC